MLKHKRVTKELNRVKKFRKACSRAGLRGAKKRWHGHNDPNSEAMTKGRKGNVIEKEREDNTSNTNTNNSLSSSSNSARTRLSADVQIQALHFSEALGGIIPPRSQSDPHLLCECHALAGRRLCPRAIHTGHLRAGAGLRQGSEGRTQPAGGTHGPAKKGIGLQTWMTKLLSSLYAVSSAVKKQLSAKTKPRGLLCRPKIG